MRKDGQEASSFPDTLSFNITVVFIIFSHAANYISQRMDWAVSPNTALPFGDTRLL